MEKEINGIVLEDEIEIGEIELDFMVEKPNLENIEITPSQQDQVFNHPASDGYDEIKVKAIVGDELNVSPTIQKQEFNGLYEKVNVNGVTNEIDTNIISENIKENVSILGIRGSYVGAKYKPRKVSFYQYKGTDLNYELTNLDTSLVTEMNSMFAYNQNITSLNLSNFNTSNVTTMNMMFYQMSEITSINASSFDTSKVTNMSSMFSGCSKLTSVDVSSFNTRNVTNMSSIFSSCNVITRLDLSSFYIDSATDISYMFDGCRALTYLDIRNFNFTSKISSYNNLFRYVPTNCLIIVKDSTAKSWLISKFSSYTNIKTIAEYGG